MGSIGLMDQLMSFLFISKTPHFEFRVNQEVTKSHIEFSSSRKNMGLETKILSLSILDAEY